MAGIYLHIPFCKQACYYCDFHFSTNTDLRAEITQAIATELSIQRSYLSEEIIDTIYFGGGTPSILSSKELLIILNSIHENFKVAPQAEITLEGNPDDLLYDKLAELKSLGINRLSIGIQSFEDTVLKFLNRAHSGKLAIASFENARAVGFENISIDLMYALPHQGPDMWKRNIHQALQLNPEHISSYSLTIEAKTVFGKWAAEKKLKTPDTDCSAQELLSLIDELEFAGYEHYEVSNFSKPGFISKHNSSYWKGTKYLGVGPSAHSYNGSSRQFNVSSNHLYLKAINANQVPATIEILSPEDKINDFLLTSLRTSWGADLRSLDQEYGYDLLKIHGDYVQRLVIGEYALITNETLILTKKGRLLADKIASDLFTMTHS
jgi:oxygen-independent coproporphyrinogen III oxidase